MSFQNYIYGELKIENLKILRDFLLNLLELHQLKKIVNFTNRK